MQDVTFRDSALWTLRVAGCRRVRVQGIKILNNTRGANNDGIDPDSCQDVVISDCFIATGDDAIVIKTTKPITEKYGPCENILIRGCVLASHDSALKIGTETHGDIRNIIMSDCVVQDCSRGIGIWVRDGAVIENVQVHHISRSRAALCQLRRTKLCAGLVSGQGEPVFLSATNRKGQTGSAGQIRGVSFDHLRITWESWYFPAGRGK